MNWLLFIVVAFGPASADRVQAINKMNEGIKAEYRGDGEAALKLVQEATQLDPGYAKAHYVLGQLHTKAGRYVDAEKASRAALGVAGDDAALAGDAGYQLGVALLRQSDAAGVKHGDRKALKRKAVEAFGGVIAVDPARYKAHFRRALAHEFLEDPDAADADFRRCIRLQPAYTPCFVSMAHLYIDYGFATEALAVLDAGLKANDKDPGMWAGAGRAYFDLGRHQDAVDAYKKARAIDPDMIDVLYGLGMAYAELRMRDEAIESLQAFVAKAGNDVPKMRKRAANDTIARMQDVF